MARKPQSTSTFDVEPEARVGEQAHFETHAQLRLEAMLLATSHGLTGSEALECAARYASFLIVGR
jgi:hypothetical protein